MTCLLKEHLWFTFWRRPVVIIQDMYHGTCINLSLFVKQSKSNIQSIQFLIRKFSCLWKDVWLKNNMLVQRNWIKNNNSVKFAWFLFRKYNIFRIVFNRLCVFFPSLTDVKKCLSFHVICSSSKKMGRSNINYILTAFLVMYSLLYVINDKDILLLIRTLCE